MKSYNNLRRKNKGNGNLRGERNLYFPFFTSHSPNVSHCLSLSLSPANPFMSKECPPSP